MSGERAERGLIPTSPTTAFRTGPHTAAIALSSWFLSCAPGRAAPEILLSLFCRFFALLRHRRVVCFYQRQQRERAGDFMTSTDEWMG